MSVHINTSFSATVLKQISSPFHLLSQRMIIQVYASGLLRAYIIMWSFRISSSNFCLIHKPPSSLSPAVYVQSCTANGYSVSSTTNSWDISNRQASGRNGHRLLCAGCCGASVHMGCLGLESFSHDMSDCRNVSAVLNHEP